MIINKINHVLYFYFWVIFLIKICFMVSKLGLETYIIIIFSKQILEFEFSDNIIDLSWWY
jgi:small basic protein